MLSATPRGATPSGFMLVVWNSQFLTWISSIECHLMVNFYNNNNNNKP